VEAGMNTKRNKTDDMAYSPKITKSYSVEEILYSGGATAFANKLGKDTKSLIAKLSSLPKESFLTDDEAKKALDILNEHK
jgi:hypothetical protein